MNRTLPRLCLSGAAVLAVFAGMSFPASAQQPVVRGSGTLTCQTYCSDTKLRMTNARISWISPRMFQGAAAAAAATGAEQLQTTVYKNGFAKDLYASFSTLVGGQTMAPQAAAQPAPELPAYNLSILRVARPTATAGALAPGAESPAARTSVEVEGLEPGMRYTWRIVIGMADGQEISETVTCEAPVCPADIQEEVVPCTP